MSKTPFEVLTRKDVVIVLSYSPAGLGHLRVTDALYEGLPEDVHPLLLSSTDMFIRQIHRGISVNPILKNVMEALQNGPFEAAYTKVYRAVLERTHNQVRTDLLRIIDQQIVVPKVLLIVASHFGLAHQLALVKKEIEDERGIKVLLLMQVTDDSPQYIWYVPGADVIVVPSHYTKRNLQKYAKTEELKQTKIAVAAYPISPKLAKRLSEDTFKEKQQQLNPKRKKYINVSIPISGAAVGLSYTENIIAALRKQSSLFRFHLTSKESTYTQSFLDGLRNDSDVFIASANNDREIVDLYQEVYEKNIISLEITKPSEQSFKALHSPQKIGGSILLFAVPVGRQEYDNINFLKRHLLLPNDKEESYLLQQFKQQRPLNKNFLDSAENWRCITLPKNPMTAAALIWYLREQKVFTHMLKATVKPQVADLHKKELHDKGVDQFWGLASQLVEKAFKTTL